MMWWVVGLVLIEVAALAGAFVGAWLQERRMQRRAQRAARWWGLARHVRVVVWATRGDGRTRTGKDGSGQAGLYWISSTTLAAAYAYLTRRLPEGAEQEPEWMLAATGLRLPDGGRTLEQLIEIRLARQSGAVAAFDMQDFTRAALVLYEHGQALQAVFHSHRFAGPPAPSGTDWRLAEVLEGAYPAVQAVFSEDGYVRFFGRRAFAVRVFGKGVEQHGADSKLFRIVERSTLADPSLGQ